MPSSSFPVGNTVPALKTTTVNRPVPALKKKRPSRREQKIQPPGPGAEKTQPPRPVPPPKKNTTAPSRLPKKKNRPVPPRKKKKTAPSRFGKEKQPPRPASEKKKQPPRPASEKKKTRPVPPKKLPRKIPSRPVPPRISTPIFCQSRVPAEMKKVGQPSIFPPSRPVEILAVHVKPWFFVCLSLMCPFLTTMSFAGYFLARFILSALFLRPTVFPVGLDLVSSIV